MQELRKKAKIAVLHDVNKVILVLLKISPLALVFEIRDTQSSFKLTCHVRFSTAALIRPFKDYHSLKGLHLIFSFESFQVSFIPFLVRSFPSGDINTLEKVIDIEYLVA